MRATGGSRVTTGRSASSTARSGSAVSAIRRRRCSPPSPGVATVATLIPLEGEFYRLAVARGEVLDTPELPLVQMPYFHFRPDSGMRPFLTSWLRNGGTHHFCLNLGDHVERWRLLAELARNRPRRDLKEATDGHPQGPS